jgi:hypothetical protein
MNRAETMLRIEDSGIRRLVAIAMGGLLALLLLWMIFSSAGIGAMRWVLWAWLVLVVLLIVHLVGQWRSATPFLLAAPTGIRLKDAASLGEIPWRDIRAIDRVPFVKSLELRLADRWKYLARLGFWRMGLGFNLAVFGKISVPLHFTGHNVDDTVRALRALWTENR